ncbi:MAG: oligosaccharide flippase family protein [Lachnospiraceae bacterium]
MRFSFLENKKNPSVSVVAMWYVLSNLLTRGLGLITTPIFSRLLTKSEYGQFSNFITWESILVIILSLQLLATIPRARYDYPGEENKYLASMLFLGNAMTLIFAGAVELCPVFFTQLLGMELKYIRLMLLNIFFTPAFSLWQMKFRMEQKYKIFVFLSSLSAVLGTVFSLILVLNMENKFEGRLYGYIIPLLLLNSILWIYTWFKARGIGMNYIIYAFPIALPLVFHSLSGNLLQNSDRVMLTNLRGTEETAMYTMGSTVSMITSVLWTSMNQAWAPWLYDNLHKKAHDSIRNKAKIYVMIFGMAIIGLMLIAPEILYILGGENYYEVRYIMPPIIAGLWCQIVYGLYINVETYMKKTYIIAIGTAMAAGINIALNLVLIPQYGYVAAAYTTLIGYFWLVVFHFLSVYREKDYRDVYDSKFNFSCMIAMLVYQFICLYFYRNTLIRYSILAIYMICIIVLSYQKRNEIKGLFRSK